MGSTWCSASPAFRDRLCPPETTSVPYIPDGRICYWGGYGGSQTVMVPEAKTTISYVMNKMGGELLGSARTSAYLTAAFAALNA